MFKFIKEIFNFTKEMKNSIKQNDEARKIYLSMNTDELAKLSDEELFEAVLIRTEDEVDSFEDIKDGVNSLNSEKKNFYVASCYEMEVNNGGLCQFFVNSSRDVATELSASLEAIGAIEHKKAFDCFIKDNNINLNDLSSFEIDEVSEFEEQNERYPFDAFDDNFCEMKPIQDYLIEYVKKNSEQF